MKLNSLFLFLILPFFFGCKKEGVTIPAVKTTLKPTVITSNATSITAESANFSLTIANSNDVRYFGFCWSTSTNPTIFDSCTKIIITNFNQNQLIWNLIPNAKYFIRAYVVTNNGEVIYGNEVNFSTIMPTIGMQLKGGILFYVLKQGDIGYSQNTLHGLIADTKDISTGIQWYNINNSSTGASGTAIGSGLNNTLKIISSQGSGNYAAKICYDLVENNYDDWYLPSIDELNILANNKSYIGNILSGFYWSSTEASLTTYASAKDIQTNLLLNFTKNYTFRVRAIRSF